MTQSRPSQVDKLHNSFYPNFSKWVTYLGRLGTNEIFLYFSSVLWKALYPTQWTRGVWSFDYNPPKESDIPKVNKLLAFLRVRLFV